MKKTNLPVPAHVALGGSTAKRWIACPGSVNLSKGMPNYETDHSRAGTAAHKVGELALRNGLDVEGFDGTTVEGVLVDEDMVAAVTVYTDYCRSLIAENPGAQYWIEMPVSLAKLNPPAEMRGTSDFPIYKPAIRELEVVDYKNGSGVVVDVVNNEQLLYYAIGVILELGPGYAIDTVKMTIVQPRAGHPDGVVRSWTMDYVDVLAFAGTLLNAARETLRPDAPLHPGSHCRFCPASAVCPAQRDHAQLMAQVSFDVMPLDVPPAPEALPPEVLGDILSKLHVLEDWAASVRAHAKNELEAGREIPGMKLVEGKRGNRKWIDEDAAFTELATRVDAEDLIVRKMKSPAQVEKLLKGKSEKAALAALVEQAEGKPIMVKDTDARPALQLHPGNVFPALPSAE